METPEKSIIETISQFIRRSVTIKLVSIFILMMLLMIPMEFVRSLINERDTLRESAVREVSGKWANEQNIYGPILTIPYNKQVIEDGKTTLVREQAHILPSLIIIDGKIKPQSLYRGIYKVVVYDSKVSIKGSFSGLDKYLDEISHHELLWNEAFLTINVSDLRGIKDKVNVKWNGVDNPVDPGSKIPELISSGITVNSLFAGEPMGQLFDFSFDLHLQGSQYLSFIPLGKETKVNISSNWQDPSFSGSFLPDERTVNDKGFSASYKILELNRNYPQFWTGNQHIQNMQNSAFGVNLLLPSNDYQKATRSTKYALLAIALTFLTFFLVEIFNKNRVHPFQYILIGLSLVLFYTLLISISEHLNFDLAYIISSLSVIAMIGLYSKTIFDNLKQSLILVLILVLTYTFVYITLQIQDYALLIGSVGLTVILGVTMYITSKVNWYDLNSLNKGDS